MKAPIWIEPRGDGGDMWLRCDRCAELIGPREPSAFLPDSGEHVCAVCGDQVQAALHPAFHIEP